MFDEIQRLRENASLARLLAHYAQVGAADRMAWQDRIMEWDSVQPPELVKLHGELLAHAWLEMNVGFAKGKGPGAMGSCYRITLAGQRALRQAAQPEDETENVAEAA
jgi:hypothetical protein